MHHPPPPEDEVTINCKGHCGQKLVVRLATYNHLKEKYEMLKDYYCQKCWEWYGMANIDLEIFIKEKRHEQRPDPDTP